MTTLIRRRSAVAVPSSVAVAGLALAGAALIVAGVALPWFSLFAGLQPVSAVGTLNGTILLGSAVVAGALGIVSIVADRAIWRRLLTAVGIGLTAFSAYLAVQLMSTFRDVSADPLMVAQLGPGLGLVIIGALSVLATSMIGDRSGRSIR